jgi:hypothetical protein
LGALAMGIAMIAHLGPDSGQYFLIYYVLYNWLPVLNPLITILTIDDYRRGLIGIFKRQQTHNQTTPIMPFVKS